MNNDPIIIDEKSRWLIANKIDENYFVQAGAGSGKTTVLVKRMIKMVQEGIDISHICAITFTKAAANEFYERFQKALIEKSNEDSIYKDRYLNALKNIDLAFMGTIDSFCNMILSEHPSVGGIPSNSTIIDENRANELYKNEYANILNGLYNDEQLQSKAKAFLRYDNYPEELFILTLNTILAHRDCKIVVPEYKLENIDIKYKDEIKTVRKIVKVLCDNPNFITSSNVDEQLAVVKAFETYKNTFYNSWDDNIPNLLNAYNKTFNNKKFRLVLDDSIATYLKEGMDYFIVHEGKGKWYELNPDRLPKIIDYLNDIKYCVCLDFVYSASKLILNKLRKNGQLTYTDYLLYLKDTLANDAKKDGKLIKHIYDRHRYFLIDEFQDTDPIQAEIFFYLAAKDIKANWKDCIPHKGSLFIVGDPKQSIYRFKNADVASYLAIKNMFKHPIGEQLSLYCNFRSTNKIKDYFNNTFNRLLVDNDDQAAYDVIPLDTNKCNGISNVYKYNVPFRANTDLDRDEYKVANIILKLYKNDDYKIDTYDENKNPITRCLDFNDFMLITPSKASLANYTRVFRQYGIPYYVEGNIVFCESKAFKLFVDFFSCIANPYDNRYLYGLLKSKLFNISEKNLNIAKESGYSFNVLDDYKNIDLPKDIINALDIINEYIILASKLSASSLFNHIINNIDAFKYEGNENMEYVYFALELLKQQEFNKQIITNIDAANYLNDLLLNNNDIERCPGFSKNNNQVHLANLHKVKGLEAPVVILAHPRANTRSASFRLVRNDSGNSGYIFDVKKKLDVADISVLSTNRYDDTYKMLETESLNQERLRLSYVAATRAKNILIISNLDTKTISKSNPWAELLDNPNYVLNDIELNLNDYKSKDICISNVSYDDIELVNNINNTQLADTKYIEVSPSKIDSNIDIDYDELTIDQIKDSNNDTLATIIGSLIHRLMQLIVMSKDTLDKDIMINCAIYEYVTNDYLDKKQYFIDVLNDVYTTMHNGGYKQANGDSEDLLQILSKADNVYTEVPYTYLDENNCLYSGIIDLIYLINNELYIIDYKTNKNSDNLELHYQNQLKSYKNAVKQIMGIEAKDVSIYHIKHI